MAATFGLITEGPTDQVILRTILARNISPDVDIRPVQPNTDATDNIEHFGGWVKVLDYCKSAEMKIVLQAYDYTIIQIDTDVCEEYGVVRRKGGRDLTDVEIVEKTKEKIIENIGNEVYVPYKEKIIFAISHSSLECWLLPLYFNDNRQSKTVNCCETLNQELFREGFTIDCNSKKEKFYQKICKKIKSKAQVESMSVHNNSFQQFIHQLTELKSNN